MSKERRKNSKVDPASGMGGELELVHPRWEGLGDGNVAVQV